MSVDLGDPEIARIREEVLDTAKPATWFLCHYSPTATTPKLSLVTSGSDPIVSQWTEQLGELKAAGDEVAFGYGEFKGKGLVVHYLSDRMSGVKRARAVVHSRAFASLFPDYSALITIADPSQLSQELIDEKLGLNYHVQRAQPNQSAHIPVPEETRSAPPEIASKDDGAPSSTPHTVSTPPSAPPQYPSHQPQPQAQMSSFSTSSHSTPISTSSGTAHQYQLSTSSPQRSRHVSESGATSEAHPDRQRKVSLTTRLGKAFGNPAMQGRTSDPAPPSSPGSSPASTSKFKSSISKAFRRTSADAPPHEPRAGSPGAPPVPPKDDPMSQGMRRPSEGQYRTPSGGVGFSPVSAVPSPRSDSLPQTTRNLQTNGNGSPAGSLTPSNVATQNHSTPAETRLSPSPSAQRVFTEARIKSLSQEEEIQSRFRKDLHLDEFGTTDRTAVNLNEDTEEELRLPYDVSDDRLSEHAHGKREVAEGSDIIPAALHLGQPIDTSTNGASQSPVADKRTQHSSHEDADPIAKATYDTRGTVPASSVALTRAGTQDAFHQNGVSPEHEERKLAAAAETARLEEAGEERRRREEDALARAEEEESIRRAREAEELERRRVEEEESERARLEGEETARQERLRAEDEARRVREAEERRITEEEQRRVLEEEEARRKEEEKEKLRIALEEQRRIEEERLREEEERQRLEEERRVQVEKEEAERIRKEDIKRSLLDGKSSGGVMLRGFVTVQTTKSPIWRRRYFHLQSGELRLFKSEGDEKPIQVVYLGSKAKIEHAYEESQVQGSWKIVSDGQAGREEFFVFADSPDEKETILEGLQLAIA